jgi:hypothetical protein
MSATTYVQAMISNTSTFSIYATVKTIAADGTITAGVAALAVSTAVTPSGNSYYVFNSVIKISANKFMIFYAATASTVYAIVGQVSGTTITFGSAVAVNAATSTFISAATNGANSVFNAITATGGGGGARTSNAGDTAGYNGGSGGGGGGSSGSLMLGGTGVSGQGYAGGNNNGPQPAPYPGGGGGGAGSVGADANNSTGVSGNGGSGYTSSITGTSVSYAGGGGGGNYGGGTPGTASAGGGAGSGSGNGTAGTANKGGGGGGANSAGTGGNGGSGVVIIRTVNAVASTTGSPTTTTSGIYTIYTFTSSGSITF